MWSISVTAQDLTSCGDGYFVDLSIRYTPTSFGLELCGCSEEVANCELLHVIMRQGSTPLDCQNISITERWWREQRDLIDIFDPDTCEEYPESASHSDRYEIDTEHLDPGDTLRLLVCKTDPEDDFVMEFRPSPGPSCSALRCAPQMSCPVETSLHPDGQCRYIIPDFIPNIILRDTCEAPPTIVTGDFTITQDPPPGTEIDAPLFVEIAVANDQGEVIATCDVSILLTPNGPPSIEMPQGLTDILAHDPFPLLEDIFATDTVGLGFIQQIPAFATIDSFERDDCAGYTVTYRWSATDGCGLTSETSTSFNVLPDESGPIFSSMTPSLDTVEAGDDFPEIEDLQAANPDGSIDGVVVTATIDSFEVDNCHGYEVTYRWVAIDSCAEETIVTSTFFVLPNRLPPTFIDDPQDIPNIYASDSLPLPEDLIAESTDGTLDDVVVVHSFEILDGNPCDSLEVIYMWRATDACGLITDVSRSFFILPDTLSGFASQGTESIMLESSVECSETAQIVVPIDLEQFRNHVVTIIILDENEEIIDEYNYTGPDDYEFGNGAFQVIYNIADQCGNSVQDTINIQVEDVSAPLFVCNDDHFIILTDFNSCTAMATWPIPIVQDNCDGVDLTQISGPGLGQQVPVGTYDIGYEATDGSGNSSNCSFQLIVSSTNLTTLSCEQVDLYVDATCETMITVEHILNTETIECLPDFELSVITTTDTLIGDTIDLTGLLNQSLSYQFCDLQTGICCGNSIMIIDTIAPILTCIDTVRLTCLEDPLAYRPDLFQECTNITWRIKDLATTEVCNDTEVNAQVTREFIAFDRAGNASRACVVVIEVTRINLIELNNDNEIIWPADTIVSCQEHDLIQLSNRALGTPLLDLGISTIRIEEICNIISMPTDSIVLQSSCVTIIKRTWLLRNGRCDQNQQEVSNVQQITIRDESPPTANVSMDTFRLLVNRDDCYAYFNASNIIVPLSDDCQQSFSLSWSIVEDGRLVHPRDSILVFNGLNQIPIALLDDCGNIGYDTLQVTVRDHIKPVAVCLEHTVISVSDEEVYFPATALDVGSLDNCEIAEVLVRKMNRTCPSEDSRFRDHVKICCADVGDTITLMLNCLLYTSPSPRD